MVSLLKLGASLVLFALLVGCGGRTARSDGGSHDAGDASYIDATADAGADAAGPIDADGDGDAADSTVAPPICKGPGVWSLRRRTAA